MGGIKIQRKERHSEHEKAADQILLMREIDRRGGVVREHRQAMLIALESKYGWFHSCLLLAVFGAYNNGLIRGTDIQIPETPDFSGFEIDDSVNVHHLFDAIQVLREEPELSAFQLQRRLRGDFAVYSFVVHYFRQGLLNVQNT